MVRAAQKFGLDLTGGLIATFGVLSVILAFSLWQPYREEIELSDTARRILLGERFNPNQLGALKREVDGAAPNQLSPLGLNSVAVIRLRLLETDWGSESKRADMKAALGSALAIDPNNSFLWLAKYSLQDPAARTSKYGLGLLNMSYLSGPNEAWIAIKRSPLAAGVFSSLSSELSERVASEFVGLVTSGLYSEATNSLVVLQEPARQKILGRLAQVDRVDRLEFRKALRASNLNWPVPGLVEPPARPY